MTRYESNIDVTEAARLLQSARRVIVTSHAKPDGDAFGSTVALVSALRRCGREAEGWLLPPVPTSLNTMDLAQQVSEYDPARGLADDDLLVIVDTGAYAQLAPIKRIIEAHLERTLILDHHLTGDVPAAKRIVDGSAAACCEVIAAVIDALEDGERDLYDQTVCQALFIGIASDTGWFRFSSTSPRTHELAARLLRRGVDHAELYRQLEQTDRPEKLALLMRALSSLRLLAGGRAALMVLSAGDFAETGAVLEETERFVDVPQSVFSVELVVLVTQPPEPPADAPGPGHPQRRAEDRIEQAMRISFRSKPGEHAVNVAEVAEQLGGGGHARAAGAKVVGSLTEVTQRVAELVTAALAQKRGG